MAQRGGRGLFLVAGVDSMGNPSPGYHLIKDDRTFSVRARVANTQPIIKNGSAYIVNVSPGYYCKALVNRTSILLGAGQHQVCGLWECCQHLPGWGV